MSYDHNSIDKKWQNEWEKREAFKAVDFSPKPKFYSLVMFPYPSGAGLHVGHMAAYTPTDVVARYKRQKGFNVLHPIGYDAFGLPAEQYAIQTGIHPEITTQKAIDTFRTQLKAFGFSFDWSREVSTCDPSFYKWTQFIFGEIFKSGLAYQKEVPVNWCPALKTVLANEEVIDGKSERGDHPVIRKPMKQWMLKITEYANQLLEGLDKINWPDRTKEGQRNWIGKSRGAEVDFAIDGHSDKFTVFTTRPDTIFGVTFMVLAPEHPLVSKITPSSHKKNVDEYVYTTASKSEVQRKADTKKTGTFTGAYAKNPFNNDKIPIWIADYVLMDYGTGAIMAVPGHDERDFEFAKTYNLDIKRVLTSETELPFTGEGQLVNSDFLNGLDKDQAINKAIEVIEQKKLGKATEQFKLRDWLFSRQRYWGEPFPILHTNKGAEVLPVEELPVILPSVPEYEPSESGEPPLARNPEWVNYKNGKRETDTMPGSAGSSWYFLRYIDPKNSKSLVDFEKQKYWMPVDLYMGGPEHTVGHLLYSRFWQKVLFKAGLVSHDEPFKQLAHQGMILGPDGEKMSKSRGNVINPDSVREEYGADALRCFILFLGPLDRDKPWNEQGITGVKKFLERTWRLCLNDDNSFAGTDEAIPEDLNKVLHKTIKKVGEDIESLNFNTAISSLMILLNEITKHNCRSKIILKNFIKLLSPFAPHVTEEIWQHMGEKDLVSLSAWPTFDSALTIDDLVSMGVQINGKKRGVIQVGVNATQEEAVKLAQSEDGLAKMLVGKEMQKIIYVPGRILNIILK